MAGSGAWRAGVSASGNAASPSARVFALLSTPSMSRNTVNRPSSPLSSFASRQRLLRAVDAAQAAMDAKR